MTNAQRLADLEGREFLPAARELRIVMQAAEARRRLVTRPTWTIRPRTRLRIERIGAWVGIFAAIGAVLCVLARGCADAAAPAVPAAGGAR